MGRASRSPGAAAIAAWIAIAGGSAALHAPPSATATTCLRCDAQLVHADCSPARYGEVLPVGIRPTLAAECEEISCAPSLPPEREPRCGVLHRRVTPSHFLVRDSNLLRVAGAFEDHGRCGVATLLAFSAELPAGSYAVSTRVVGCVAMGEDVLVGPPEATFLATDSTTPGDCDGDGRVRVDELIRGVAVALGTEWVAACRLLDADDNDVVDVSEVLRAVAEALADQE